MQHFEIPTGIWINLGLFVAAAVFIRIKLAAADKRKRVGKKDNLVGRAGAA
jgi:hypothetical protein